MIGGGELENRADYEAFLARQGISSSVVGLRPIRSQSDNVQGAINLVSFSALVERV